MHTREPTPGTWVCLPPKSFAVPRKLYPRWMATKWCWEGKAAALARQKRVELCRCRLIVVLHLCLTTRPSWARVSTIVVGDRPSVCNCSAWRFKYSIISTCCSLCTTQVITILFFYFLAIQSLSLYIYIFQEMFFYTCWMCSHSYPLIYTYFSFSLHFSNDAVWRCQALFTASCSMFSCQLKYS